MSSLISCASGSVCLCSCLSMGSDPSQAVRLCVKAAITANMMFVARVLALPGPGCFPVLTNLQCPVLRACVWVFDWHSVAVRLMFVPLASCPATLEVQQGLRNQGCWGQAVHKVARRWIAAALPAQNHP